MNRHKDIFEELQNLIKENKIELFLNKVSTYIKQGFDINETNEYGNTLLHLACRKRNLKIVTTLINSYDAKTDIQNLDGRNPLHIAAIYGSSDVAYYICQDRSTKNNIDNTKNIIAAILQKSKHTILMTDNNNMTPINYFVIHSNIESNSALNKIYKSYKRKIDFFETIKQSTTEENYKLTMNIFFLIKKSY